MAKVVKTICQMCGTNYGGCGIDVHVEDDKIIKIEGTKGHPVNDGGLCAKGLAATQLEYDPKRLLYPHKRVGDRREGKHERITWDEAFDTIITRLKAIIESDDPRAISWLKGQGPGWESNMEYLQRFMISIGSPNIVTHGHNCHIARMIGHLHTYGSKPDPDYEGTKCILLWGNNPGNRCMGGGMPHIMRAKQKGAKLIVLDPRFTRTAAKADMFVQLRPGSDGALALGMLNVIIEENLYDKAFVEKWTYGFDQLSELVKRYPPETVEEISWVPAHTIREVARLYATTKPAILFEENGIDQQPNVVQTTRALSILRAITGNIDVPGGNVFNVEAPPLQGKRDMSLRNRDWDEMEKARKESINRHPLYFPFNYCTVPEWVDTMLTGDPYPLKAVIVHGMNPAVISTNSKRVVEALKKVEFLVFIGQYMNRSARLADIVLPAATFLERSIVTRFPGDARFKVDGTYYQLMQKVIEPLGEARSDYDIIAELTRRMGHEDAFPWKNVEEAIDYELEPLGITVKEMKENPQPICRKHYPPEELYGKYERFFSSPVLAEKKVAFYSTGFERLGYNPLPDFVEPGESPMSNPDLAKEYPLICMASLKPGLFTHSQFRSLPWLNEIMPDPWIEIHSEKAYELGVKDGEIVVVRSRVGSIEIKCKVIDTMDPRVVALTHGWGDVFKKIQPVTNEITPDDIRCPVSDGESNRCFLVKVRPAGKGSGCA